MLVISKTSWQTQKVNKILALILFITAIGVVIFAQPAGPLAVLFGTFCTVIAVFVSTNSSKTKKNFFAKIVYRRAFAESRAGDSNLHFRTSKVFRRRSLTYDNAGYALYNSWFGYYDQIKEYYLQFGFSIFGHRTLSIANHRNC